MDASRLENGAVVAVGSALIVLVGLFLLDWYSPDTNAIAPVRIEHAFLAQLPGTPPQLPNDLNVSTPSNVGAWDGAGFFGTIANLIVLAAALGALAVALLQALGSQLPERALPLLLALSAAAVLVVVLRMLLPPADHLSLEIGIWVTLAGSLGLLAGAVSLRREQLAAGARTRRRPPATS